MLEEGKAKEDDGERAKLGVADPYLPMKS